MITDKEILNSLKDKSVLLIDDEKFSRAIIRRALHPIEVQEAPDGADGLYQFLGDSNIAMILCDFNMPVMDGLKVLKAIRSGFQGARHAVPFLMLTGTSDSGLVSLALKLDVDGFVVKPVSQNTLETRIRHVFTHARDIQSPKHYAKIDVDDVSERLLKSMSVPVPEDEKTETAEPAPTSGRKMQLDAIPVNAMLTCDIRAPTGELLVAAGQQLSERLIRRLSELAPLGFAPSHVWIEV